MNIEVNKKKFTPFITAQQINEQINILAAELNRDYEGKRPLFIAILNGSFMFAADLFKAVTIEAEICFSGTHHAGRLSGAGQAQRRACV